MRTGYFYSSNIRIYDYSSSLLQIAGVTPVRQAYRRSGAVASAVVMAWCHFLKSSYAFHTAAPAERLQYLSAPDRRL